MQAHANTNAIITEPSMFKDFYGTKIQTQLECDFFVVLFPLTNFSFCLTNPKSKPDKNCININIYSLIKSNQVPCDLSYIHYEDTMKKQF